MDSDIFALVCLFDYDKIFVSDPAVVLELKIVKPKEFPKDMHIFRKVYLILYNQFNIVCCVWEECSGDDRRRMETSQENHDAYLFS